MNEEEVSYWPQDDRFHLLSGIDLLHDTEEGIREKFMKGIRDAVSITHVFYLVANPGRQVGVAEPYGHNITMLRNAVAAIESIASNLEFIHLQYGTFIYGVCFTDDFYMPVPLSESLPPLRPPFRDLIAYPLLSEWMENLSKGKTWKWCETRPDDIIGFVPRPNEYNLAYPTAMFLSLYAYVEGKGVECPFPGSFGAWKALCNHAGADMIAKSAIHLSLASDFAVSGEGFNIASSQEPWSWEMQWPALCSWFGLKGTPPVDHERSTTVTPSPDAYIASHVEDFKRMIQKHGLKDWYVVSPTMDGTDNWGLTKLNFDRHLSLEKIRATGYLEEESPIDSWTQVLQRMRDAKLIPRGYE
ncbi:hypothetical protein AJ80_04278 [Polytolypa hystricis UAMH7299]|uniref:PRISE-like Rossmann-fold domain-containing protein n=1 Tax=Polytolypa hystricis (strain UAMH7299) TaxID=1447883 RepID=A0A2B7YD13_POLH7|nr:hypothetical protein AJ80_04278 [Polytolypa hystricis UAMH7299]